jgi:hypothetical protein
MDHYSFLRWKVEDRIATVCLSRPPVNAVNQEAVWAALERRAPSYLPPEQPAGQAVNQRRDQR